MGVEIRIDTKNLDRLAKDLSPQTIDKLVRAATLDAEGGAKVGAPVDTGYLRNSIQSRMSGQAEGEVSVGAEYGAFVERGTRRQKAQPYLEPAAQKAIERLEAALSASLRRAS